MLSSVLILAMISLGDVDPADRESFEKEVRPILVGRCQGCHGAAKQKGDLRLDSRAAALTGGRTGPALVPGKPDESALIDAVNYGELQMPPKSKLPDAEIAALTRWVQAGAPWPDDPPAAVAAGAKKPFDLAERARHWSFRPIARAEPPAVKDEAWPVMPVDRFLLAALESRGLKPAPEADKRTILRRVTFDLTGLPPTPAEVAAFLADESPGAFEAVVDRLLASPHYGERWGRHWLDLVRFAETSGHEFDYDIPGAWRYRDYVVRAFNDDLPYDRFLTEHVAGDLLASPRRNPADGSNESILATGFYFLGEGVHSPVDVRDDEILRVDNQIDVLSKAFLGLSVSCARCHDHKFDAISTKDYYALAGYFQSSRHQQAFVDSPERVAPIVAELERIKAAIAPSFPSSADLASAELYGEAAARVLATTEPSGSADILFEDFEGSHYEKWIAVGSAFGDGPIRLPLPSYQGEVGAKGLGLVGSHNGRVEGGVGDRDGLTGTLTSDEFPIERDYLHALIGGGSHPGKTCVELLVGGEVRASLTGRDENPMRPRVIDVRAWRGQRARLRVVDAQAGHWGNISLDHVVFSDDPSPPDSPERRVRSEAKRSGLDPARLARWVRVLDEHPTRAAKVDDPTAIAFADFDGPDFAGWAATGDAFGRAPTGPGAFRVAADGLRPIPKGVAHSGLVSDRLQGVLRSPTFPIDRRFVHLKAWGRSGRINLIVDGFEKVREPIYGGLTRGVDAESPRWITLDVGMWKGHRAYLELGDGATLDYTGSNTRRQPGDGYLAVDEVRFSDGPPPSAEADPSPPVDLDASVAAWRSGDVSTGSGLFARAVAGGLIGTESLPPLLARYRSVEATIPEPTLAPAILDGSPEDERVHIRGSAKTLGEIVPRRFLEAIAGPSQAPPTDGSGRLELARRMLDPSCAQTARVMANRIWKGHFGVGLVKTPDDLGVMGEAPSNSGLLDWLATEFRSRGWSVKAMHRLILLSRAYRMSSEPDPAADAADPDNRLLHRMSVRRLEAESVRDAMLAVSGRLDPRVGGPSVAPHLTAFMEGRGRPSRSGPLDGDGRRSLYLNVRRNFLSPMLLSFDFPAPASTMGRRNVSNVPAQSLTLLNDPFVIGQARAWAGRLLADPSASRSDRVEAAYLGAFGRPPSEGERSEALAFLGSHPEPDGVDAWADLAHVLFNVKEFVFLP